jgi:hypothetical protein
MQKLTYGLLAITLVLVSGAWLRADDKATDAKAIINKAIKATGGEEQLAKYKAVTWKGKGKINLMGTEIEFTIQAAAQPPKQSRGQSEADFNGMKFERLQVVNGDKGWISMMGNTEEMSEDQLATAKEELYAGWVATLEPLKDPAFKLTPLGESKVADQPAVGLKVSRQDHKDINLYFDKDKGLLVKLQRRAKDMMGQEVDQETFYSDYKESNGLQHARKQKTKRDGSDFLAIDITEFKPVEKLDDSTFAKPQ